MPTISRRSTTSTARARLPDSDRTWLTIGGRYKYNSALNFDVGAAYIFVKNGSINNSGNPASIASNGLINGSYDNHVVIVSGRGQLPVEVGRA